MGTSVLATMCAERLTKLLVRYSRAQPPVGRNQSHCVDNVLSPLPRSEATTAFLKPMNNAGQDHPPSKSANKWQPMGTITSIGQRFQREAMDEICARAKDRLLPKTEPRRLNFSRNHAFFPNKSRGLEDWKKPEGGRYSAPFVSLFQAPNCPSLPKKSFSHPLAFDRQKLYRDCY
uniref:MIP14126p n=2 Tax=Drosophila melanogaster TaxID=7227 RepID=C9QPE8_DROME|nr:MIP14126p [Drosophila melanogaster]AOQ12127.1 whip-PA [synthetic construct]